MGGRTSVWSSSINYLIHTPEIVSDFLTKREMGIMSGTKI